MTSPVYVDWAITRLCNLRCRHCVGMEEGELGHDEAVGVAKDIISLDPKWVILEGGEPLLRTDLPEIGKMFRGAGIDVFVITNGNAFTESRLRDLASFAPKVLFSFDGADAATYESIKRGGRFEEAMKWARRCAELGIFQGITAVLTRKTMVQVKAFMGLAESLGGKSVIFLPLKPFHGNSETDSYYRQDALSQEEQAAIIEEIYSFQTSLDIFYDEPFLWNLSLKPGFSVNQSGSGITIPGVKGCAAAHSLYIQTDGSIRPCMFCPAELTFGNVKTGTLPSIWQKMQSNHILSGWADQKLRNGACSKCPQFESCRGCLARTTILSGDHLASDPCCPLRPEINLSVSTSATSR